MICLTFVIFDLHITRFDDVSACLLVNSARYFTSSPNLAASVSASELSDDWVDSTADILSLIKNFFKIHQTKTSVTIGAWKCEFLENVVANCNMYSFFGGKL